MDTQRNLLFGLLAYQKGVIDADCLAETCAAGSIDQTVPLADRLVAREMITVDQRDQIDELLRKQLAAHDGNPEATLAANLDRRSLEALKHAKVAENGTGDSAPVVDGATAAYEPTGPVLIGSLSPEDNESRERYTLTHLYAKGGMGQVWLAHDPALGREIALKELRPDQMGVQSICSRFLTEARVTAQLEHPGIVPVYELGDKNLPYYTMRFVRGGTLSQAARAYHKARVAGKADQVGMVRLLSAFVGVCHAMAYAHSKGFIHRDLKGQNVVLGDFGEVIVLDWGLAKRIHPGPGGEQDGPLDDFEEQPEPVSGEAPAETLAPETNGSAAGSAVNGSAAGSAVNGSAAGSAARRSSPRLESGAGPEGTIQGQILGTPAFMAPEQASGRQNETDARTDVYGLGAILYEVLTGQPPFHARTTNELLHKVRHTPPTPPRQVNPEVDPALEAVCLKALSKAQGDRYGSASDLAQEVQRFLADEPVQAWPEPWTRRALRWARKHRTGVAAAAGLLVTSTVALGVSTALISRERNEALLQGEQARTAVNDFYVDVAENLLEDRLDPLQEKTLRKALGYYEKFTAYAAHDPKVKLEKGQAYRRMGDIQRRLGQPEQAEGSFRQALAILEPLARQRPDDREVRHALATARIRLGDFLLRGSRLDEADREFKQAAAALEASSPGGPADPDDRWLLAKALGGQAEIARRTNHLDDARSVAGRACELLEDVLASKPEDPQVRNDLAQANDFLGKTARDLGDTQTYEKAYRRAYELLDTLIAKFPTVARYRETMTHICNGLGEFERKSGRVSDCEALWKRELKEAERLAADFPGRPEYQRLLAGGCSNVGGVLAEQDRIAEGEPILRRAIDLDNTLLKTYPQDTELRLDLGTCSYNLGYLQFRSGQPEPAIQTLDGAYEQAAGIPGAPARARRIQAMARRYRGEALDALGRNQSDEAYREGVDILEKLTAEAPENIPYQIEYAQCLEKLAGRLAASGKPDDAESLYQRALAALDSRPFAELPRAGRLEKAMLLSSLALTRHEAKRPGSRELSLQSIEIARQLAADVPPTAKEHQVLALAHNNLGETLKETGKYEEALPELQAAANKLDEMVAAAPTSVENLHYLGYVHDQQGQTLLLKGDASEARVAFDSAVKRQKDALKHSGGRSRGVRDALTGSLVRLTDVNLSLGDYTGTIQSAVDLAQANQDSAELQINAARFMSRCALKLEKDPRLSKERKEELSRDCLGRAVVMLRLAVDLDARMAGAITSDKIFKELLDRPAFRSMIESMVKLEPRS